MNPTGETHDEKFWQQKVVEVQRILGKPPDRLKKFAESVLKETDRGCAIISAEILNQSLEDLLREYMRKDQRLTDPLFRTFGPLATFSSRIQIAYLLKLIPTRIYDELETVRRIRNELAHTWHAIDFSDQKITGLLTKLIGSPSKETVEVADRERIDLGEQRITREQFVRRFAFHFAVTEMRAWIEVFQFSIRLGDDVRRLVTIFEERKGSTHQSQ